MIVERAVVKHNADTVFYLLFVPVELHSPKADGAAIGTDQP